MLKGEAHKFGDSISTDHIIPGRYAHLRSNLPELAKHVLEDADVNFANLVGAAFKKEGEPADHRRRYAGKLHNSLKECQLQLHQ